RRRGLAHALMSPLYRGLRKSVGLNLYWVYSNSCERLPVATPPDSDFTLRELTPDEVQLFAHDEEIEFDASAVDRARNHNHLCFGALVGNMLAASTWLSFSRAPHVDGVEVHVTP